MTRRTMGLVAGMLALTLAACAGEASAPVLVDAQRAHLVQRTGDLAASVTAAGRMSDEDRVSLAALARDVEDWQALNRQGDAGVVRTGGLRPGITFASRNTGGGGTCAGVCVPVVVMGDLICFITGSNCIGGQKKCLYDCFFNLDALPVRRV
ncbi:MAG: hypothetical protein H7066_12775 [Cytophagaceae bacterium]|nr:hypothetical protein [Gemmatimonadaceae bacterium]